jgi:hypothetical protein
MAPGSEADADEAHGVMVGATTRRHLDSSKGEMPSMVVVLEENS